MSGDTAADRERAAQRMEEIANELGAFASNLDSLAAALRSDTERPAEPEDDDPVRCLCDWLHPVDGTVDPEWPAELDLDCPVHCVHTYPVPRQPVDRADEADPWEKAREIQAKAQADPKKYQMPSPERVQNEMGPIDPTPDSIRTQTQPADSEPEDRQDLVVAIDGYAQRDGFWGSEKHAKLRAALDHLLSDLAAARARIAELEAQRDRQAEYIEALETKEAGNG